MRTIVVGAALAGCAGARPAPSVPGRGDRVLLDVPFFPDDTDQCGPSALASVLAFWGTAVTPEELRPEVYVASLKGSLPLDLLLTAQRRGFQARLYRGGWDDLKAELRKGHPLIAFINQGLDALPLDHYVVVTGYDEAGRRLRVHSGLAKDKFVSYRRFLRGWTRTQRSTLLVLPPQRGGSSHAGP